jgi:AraC-like DNA-binding protein
LSIHARYATNDVRERLVLSRQSDVPQSKGHLNSGSPGVALERFDVAPALTELVRHVWIARWRLPPGQVSRQRVLTYPAFNLVIVREGAVLYGPVAKVQVRELAGHGWALGLLLRPGAGRLVSPVPPTELIGRSRPVSDAPVDAITKAMRQRAPSPTLAATISRWLGPTAARVDDRVRLVNRVCRLAEEDDTIVRVAQLARRVALSPRSLERLVVGHIGLTPKWLIECRRLQEAATTLHARPQTDLTQLALSLQYVDYAHFSRRYKEVLGETPDQTRSGPPPGPTPTRRRSPSPPRTGPRS